MAKRLNHIEKLARAICWAEFGDHPPEGKTAASYWNEVCDRTKEQLIREAKRFVWVYRRVADGIINDAVYPGDDNVI